MAPAVESQRGGVVGYSEEQLIMGFGWSDLNWEPNFV